MVPRLTELVDFARKSRIPMIWTQSDHSPPYGGIMLKKFSVIANQRILWPGDVSFNFYANMPQPHESELEHIIVKHKYDAFFETPLDAVLRFHKVDTVIISGTATNACCESTARSAFMRDYNVIFLSDLTGRRSGRCLCSRSGARSSSMRAPSGESRRSCWAHCRTRPCMRRPCEMSHYFLDVS